MTKTIVHIENVSIYQGNALVLKDINLDIQQGEFIYLIGKNGAGKSSLLKTLYGEIPLREGSIEIVDFQLHKIHSSQLQHLRRNVGIIFQDFQLLMDRTIFENLKFVLQVTNWKDSILINNKIEEVLDKVGLTNKGYKMIYELSGGEQQRVNIARAILNNPKLIIADEPTNNLDPKTADEIMNLLLQICKDYKSSVLMGTHEYSLIRRYPNRTIKIENTQLIDKVDKDELVLYL